MSWSDEVPAIVRDNAASGRGHRAPDPGWYRFATLLLVSVATGVAVALGILAAWGVG